MKKIINLLSSRKNRVEKIAQKYNLTYLRKQQIDRGYQYEEEKINILSGNIDGLDIEFYDYIAKTFSRHDSSKWMDPVVTSKEHSGKRTHLLVPNLRTSFLKVGNSSKIIGHSFQSHHLSNFPKQFCSINIIEKIFNEIKNQGSSNTFTNLEGDKKNKFSFGRFTYVKEVSVFPPENPFLS